MILNTSDFNRKLHKNRINKGTVLYTLVYNLCRGIDEKVYSTRLIKSANPHHQNYDVEDVLQILGINYQTGNDKEGKTTGNWISLTARGKAQCIVMHEEEFQYKDKKIEDLKLEIERHIKLLNELERAKKRVFPDRTYIERNWKLTY